MPANHQTVEALKWKKFPVLDDGFVCLVDVMGDDGSIVQAARVSYGAGTRHVSDERSLIRFLMRHRHTSPFEMAELKLLVRVPMDCWRQWIRHRTASVNEYSTRYSIAIESAQRTAPNQWRLQSRRSKQGSSRFLEVESGAALSAREQEVQRLARAVYDERLAMGVAREQARKDLSLSTYTEAYWKMDLHNLLHFLELRMHDTAQLEIRQYAQTIATQIVQPLFPLVWEAFVDFRLEVISLGRLERAVLRRILERLESQGRTTATEEDFLEAQDESWRGAKRSSEREECREKLRALGLLRI